MTIVSRPVTGHWSLVTFFKQGFRSGPVTGHRSLVTPYAL
jgi:hypothetical protein